MANWMRWEFHRPWSSFRSVRMKSMMKCNWKLYNSLLRLIWAVFVSLVFTAAVYTSFRSPSSRWQTNLLFSFAVQNFLEKWCPRMQLSMVNSMPTIGRVRLVHKLCSNDGWFLADEILVDYSQNHQSAKINSSPKFLAIQYNVLFSALLCDHLLLHTFLL